MLLAIVGESDRLVVQKSNGRSTSVQPACPIHGSKFSLSLLNYNPCMTGFREYVNNRPDGRTDRHKGSL